MAGPGLLALEKAVGVAARIFCIRKDGREGGGGIFGIRKDGRGGGNTVLQVYWVRKYSVQYYWDGKYSVQYYWDRKRLPANYFSIV